MDPLRTPESPAFRQTPSLGSLFGGPSWEPVWPLWKPFLTTVTQIDPQISGLGSGRGIQKGPHFEEAILLILGFLANMGSHFGTPKWHP